MGGRGGSSGFKSKAQRDKDDIRQRLEALVENQGSDGFKYRVSERDWQNYGQSRTYFSIERTRENSKHHSSYDYGYYDNNKEEYVPNRLNRNSVYRNYSLSGDAFDIGAAVKNRKGRKRK